MITVLLRLSMWTVIALSASLAAADDLSFCRFLPPGALATFEVRQLSATIDHVRDADLRQRLVASEPYKKWLRSGPGRRFLGFTAIVENQLGMDLWEAAHRLFGDQAVVAVYPRADATSAERYSMAVVVRLKDDEIGGILRQRLGPWVELMAEQLVTEDRDGRWTLRARDGRAFGCLAQRWLVLSNDRVLQDAAVDRVLAATPSDAMRPSLSESPAWRDVDVTTTDGTSRVSFVYDTDRLRDLTHRQRFVPEKLDNPVGSLLLGGWLELAAVAPSLWVDLQLSATGFRAHLAMAAGSEDVDTAHQTLLPVDSSAAPQAEGQLASMKFSRDWSEWYRKREALLEPHLLPQFDKFETGLSTFLAGRDFSEDVLGAMRPPVTLLATEQTYPHLVGRPGLRLPAFAVVFDLKDPKHADVFQLFFQTIGTIVNLQPNAEGRQPWVMTSEAHDGVQISYMKLLDPPAGENLPVVFNFQPAAALVGSRYIATTSLELCRDLVTTLQLPVSEQTSSDTRADAELVSNTTIVVDPAIVVELLQQNRPVIVARRVQAGRSLEEAEHELDALADLLRRLTPWTMIGRVGGERSEVTLEGGWK